MAGGVANPPYGIAHGPGPNAKEKEMGTSSRILSNLTFFFMSSKIIFLFSNIILVHIYRQQLQQ